MSELTPRQPDLDLDRQIEEAARAALLATGYRTLSELECEVRDAQITLTGVVDTYFLKQVAQQAVLQIKAVQRLHNAIRVVTRQK